ncbi:MAG: ABC-three component system protein [Alphaproteobacteria bacterium]
MTLSPLQKAFYELTFENRYLTLQGNEFQEFFRNIMEHAFPNDFVAVRPHGNTGDKKCDGFLRSKGTIYQCYAPKNMKLKNLLDKMDEDFHGASTHWTDEMKEWVFVHNDRDGIPADALKLLEKFEKEGTTNTGHHGFRELTDIVATISESKLTSLFGHVPTHAVIANVPSADILAAIQGLQGFSSAYNEADLRAPSTAKLTGNGFSSHVIELLRGGFVGAKRVQQFFDAYPVPDYVDTIATAFKREYNNLRSTTAKPDEIYEALYRYADGDGSDANRRAAVLAVLSYFFERCDIFEDPNVTE